MTFINLSQLIFGVNVYYGWYHTNYTGGIFNQGQV
jgi:hypothetical protein